MSLNDEDIPVIEPNKNGYDEIYDNDRIIRHKNKSPKIFDLFDGLEFEFPIEETNAIYQAYISMKIKNPSDFIVPKVDIQDGQHIIILDEGQYGTLPTDPNKEVLTFWVGLPDGERRKMSPNATSQKEMLAAWGSDSKNWVGKQCVVEIVRQKVFDKTKDVMYLHPVGAAKLTPTTINDEEINEENEN